jgi:hypothetical protein
LKPVFGLFAGLSTAALIIVMAQMINEGLYPQPMDLDTNNHEALSAWMNTLPTKIYIIIAISHGLSAFAAGLISSLVSGFGRLTFGLIAFCGIFIPVMIYLLHTIFRSGLSSQIPSSLLSLVLLAPSPVVPDM